MNKLSNWSEPNSTEISFLADQIRNGGQPVETLLKQALEIHKNNETTRWGVVILWDALQGSRKDLNAWFLEHFLRKPNDMDGLIMVAASSISFMDRVLADQIVTTYAACEGEPSEQWMEGVAISHASSGNFELLDVMTEQAWDCSNAKTWPQGEGDVLFLATAMLAMSNKHIERPNARRIIEAALALGGNPTLPCKSSSVIHPSENVVDLSCTLINMDRMGARTALDALLDAGLSWGSLDKKQDPGAIAIQNHPAWRQRSLLSLASKPSDEHHTEL